MRIFIFTLFLLTPFVVHASEFQTSAKQAIVVDYDTGDVLYSKNADQKMPTSSMSKVLSMVVVFDAIKNGELKLDGTLKVSPKAWRKGGSKMFVEVNNEVKVEDLIRGVIVQSGNDATIVLAEGVAGSEDAFANRLNEKAQELGMENSHFVNASGWPDDNHYSTAEDLALLGKRLIADYPEYYKYYSEKQFDYNEILQANRNPLLYRDLGADGIKTGHTEAGGFGLIGSGMRDGRRVVFVVNGLQTSKDRASESARILDWALSRFENKTIFKAGDTLEMADVTFGVKKQVELTVGQDIQMTVPKAGKSKFEAKVEYTGPLVAPVEKDQEIGLLNISVPGRDVASYPVIAKSSVAEKGFFGKTFEKVLAMISGMTR